MAMRQKALLFGGIAWKKPPADSNLEEVIRNYFIRQPPSGLDGSTLSALPSRRQ